MPTESLLGLSHGSQLTDSDLDVVPCGGVLEVVDGAQHVQGHVADVVGVESGLVGDACHHHVGVTNCLHLRWPTQRDKNQILSPHLVGQSRD